MTKGPTPSSSKRRARRTVRTSRVDDAKVEAVREEGKRIKKTAKPAKRRGKKRPAADTRMIILAISPHAAQVLRVLLNRSRADEGVINEIKDELQKQMGDDYA